VTGATGCRCSIGIYCDDSAGKMERGCTVIGRIDADFFACISADSPFPSTPRLHFAGVKRVYHI
jgi:hypothetical protein